MFVSLIIVGSFLSLYLYIQAHVFRQIDENLYTHYYRYILSFVYYLSPNISNCHNITNNC